MEIIKWVDHNWSEIEEQDNPAFDYLFDNPANDRRKKCLLVMKVLPYHAKVVGVGGYTVIEVPLKGDVISKGLFWNFENAVLFAEALAKK